MRGRTPSRAASNGVRLVTAGAVVATLGACSAILGLTDPRKDDAIGNDASTSDVAPASDAISGDGPNACTDTTSDPKNCGTCGHDCLGGECQNSTCQPVLVVDDEANLAPAYMVEDKDFLYVTNARVDTLISSASKIPKTGIVGSAASARMGFFGSPDGGNPDVNLPYQIALNANDVYVAITSDVYQGNLYQGGVAKCPGAAACESEGSYSYSSFDSYAVATNGVLLFNGWTDLQDGGTNSALYRVFSHMLVGPATDTVLYTEPAPINYLIAELGTSRLLIATSNGLVVGDITGGSSSTLAAGIEIDYMAELNGVVYFTSAPETGNPLVGSISVAGSGSAAVTQIAVPPFVQKPWNIAVDSTWVYVADVGQSGTRTSGQVFKCPIATGCGTNGEHAVILSTGASAGKNPRAIVADDPDAVYWGNRFGQIWKIAK